jgi:hypothetical protein
MTASWLHVLSLAAVLTATPFVLLALIAYLDRRTR